MTQRERNRWPQREALTAVGLMLIGCLMLSTGRTQEAGAAKETPKAEPAKPAETPLPLFEQEPFDVITLDEENENAKLKVAYLQLPNRRLPINPPPDSKLVVRL